MGPSLSPAATAEAISASGLTIYDCLPDDPDLYFSLQALEERLQEKLAGVKLAGPSRTRSKLAKQAVAAALGYPVPETFARTRPRFTGQNLDVYVQKSANLQIWNDELAATRRYAVICLDADDRVSAVR